MTHRDPAGKRDYNGLRSPPAFGGVVHDLSGAANREAAIKQAFAQQMQALTQSIYVRTASAWLSDSRGFEECEDAGFDLSADFRELADKCQLAALCYFEGLGLIQRPEPDSSLAAAIDTEQADA